MFPITQAPEPRYRTKEVSRMACVTMRQLQWWDERKILSPQMVGHTRLYTTREVFQALLFRDLKERDYTLQQIRVVAKELARQRFELPTDQHRWLLTDGKHVKLLAHAELVIAFLEQRRVPFALIPLQQLAARLNVVPRAPMARATSYATTYRPHQQQQQEAQTA